MAAHLQLVAGELHLGHDVDGAVDLLLGQLLGVQLSSALDLLLRLCNL